MRQLAKCREHFGCMCYQKMVEQLTAALKEARAELKRPHAARKRQDKGLMRVSMTDAPRNAQSQNVSTEHDSVVARAWEVAAQARLQAAKSRDCVAQSRQVLDYIAKWRRH